MKAFYTLIILLIPFMGCINQSQIKPEDITDEEIYSIINKNIYSIDDSNDSEISKKINLLDIIDIVKSNNVEAKIKNNFNAKLIEKKKLYVPPFNLDLKVFEVDDFKISNGICDAVSIYTYKQDFVQLELGFKRINASLNELKKINGLDYITSGEFHNGKAICINYLFKYYGYAINVVTFKESQKMGTFYISSDDIFFITLTTIQHYNNTMSDNYGIKL